MKACPTHGRRLATFIGLLLAVPGICFPAGSQTWTEVRSPHFVVVSNARGQEARHVAERFEMIRAIFLGHLGRIDTIDSPVTVLAAKDEATLRNLFPVFWQKKNLSHPTGVFVRGHDANYIVLEVNVSLDPSAVVPYESIYHEYVHYLMRDLSFQLPLWMVEGIAEFYGNTRIQSDRVLVGVPSTDVLWLQRTPLLPLNTLFDVDVLSPYYNEKHKTSIFYAESWALTHYLLTRDRKNQTHELQDFVELLGKGMAQREAARRTIGDPDSLERKLRKYIRSDSFIAAKLEPPKVDNDAFQVREMSEAESLAVRADFMAQGGHYPEAKAMLEKASKLDPKLGAGYEFRANFYDAMILMDGGSRDEQRLSRAEASLRNALRINPEFAPAYNELAFVLSEPGQTQRLDEAYLATLQAEARDPSNVEYRIQSVEVLEKQKRFKDAIRAATLAASMARTREEQSAATYSLAGAIAEHVEQQLRENVRNDKNAETDLESDVAGLTRLIEAGTLDGSYDAGTRFYRAAAQDLIDYVRKENGIRPDTAAAEQSLSDLDRIISGKSDISAWGITIPEVEYLAGSIALSGIGSSPRAALYWKRCADSAHAGCMSQLAAAYTVGLGGMQADPAKALDLNVKVFETGTRYTCAGAVAAHNIAGLIYFAAASYPQDNDPISWIQKSYALSDPVEARPDSKDRCGGSESRIEEFLYRLERGDRQNGLLTQAAQRLGDNSISSIALMNYLSGSLDVEGFEAAVESDRSDGFRCSAYFHAMWYAYLTKETILVDKFYKALLKFDYLTCPSCVVFARKFHPESTQTGPTAMQH
jgi:tetratricopeptide (TPR) repeat protein